jgi:hypothetical protein
MSIEDENWSLNLCLHFPIPPYPSLSSPRRPLFSTSGTFSRADNPVIVKASGLYKKSTYHKKRLEK